MNALHDDDNPALIPVEVAYATPNRQLILRLEVAPGTTAYEAVLWSDISREFSEIDPDQNAMGIFSRRLDGKTLPRPEEYVLREMDRVEIYRPLIIDPKQARLLRAKKSRPSAGETGDDKEE